MKKCSACLQINLQNRNVDFGAIFGLIRGSLPGILLLLAIAASIGLWSFRAVAAETSASQSKAGSAIPGFSLLATGTAESTLHEWNDINHKADSSFLIAPAVGLGESLAASMQIILDKDLTQKRETRIRNAIIGVRHSPWALSNVFSFSPGASVIAPLNKDSREADSLIVGLQASPRLLFNLEPIGINPISGTLSLTGTRNIHTYMVSLSKKSNREWILAPMLRLNAQLTKSISLSTSSAYTYRWTYAGNRTDDFELSEDLSWQASDQVALGIGHSNSGSTVKADGVSSNVDVFDPENSTVYASLTISI